MNNLQKQILNFKKTVGSYIKTEYKSKYYKIYNIYSSDIQNLLESYYLGGNTVPETAGIIIDKIKSKI